MIQDVVILPLGIKVLIKKFLKKGLGGGKIFFSPQKGGKDNVTIPFSTALEINCINLDFFLSKVA